MPSSPEIEFLPKEGSSPTALTAALPQPQVSISVPAYVECKPEDAPYAPSEEADAKYRCTTLMYNGQLIADADQINAWANSPKQAQLELYKAVCANKMDFAKIVLSCVPDANEGSCPAIAEKCEDTERPTRCYAQAYDEQELTLSNRPQTWGKNACDARNKLNRKACALGLDPKALKSIQCEPEPSPLVCPPIWKNCVAQDNDWNECKISKVGEINLKQPLTAVGMSRCEAEFRVQELACRFQKSELKDLSGIQCRALNKSEFLPSKNQTGSGAYPTN